MNTQIDKTLEQLARCLDADGCPDAPRLHKMYDLTLRLQSQLLGVIYDTETFLPDAATPHLSQQHAHAENTSTVVTLIIDEPLPSMKRLTEEVEEHWKAMLHTAIDEAERQGTLPYFDKALVAIEITTPRGTNNANVWDTSNRAINVIINNLKGIFFLDDNLEHMAFSVTGRWGEAGKTVLRVSECGSERTGKNKLQDKGM